jgi:hypothetical protein
LSGALHGLNVVSHTEGRKRGWVCLKIRCWRRYFGLRCKTGQRKLHNEEHHDLYYPTNIISDQIKKDEMIRACGMHEGRKKSIMQKHILPIRRVTASHQIGQVWKFTHTVFFFLFCSFYPPLFSSQAFRILNNIWNTEPFNIQHPSSDEDSTTLNITTTRLCASGLRLGYSVSKSNTWFLKEKLIYPYSS